VVSRRSGGEGTPAVAGLQTIPGSLGDVGEEGVPVDGEDGDDGEEEGGEGDAEGGVPLGDSRRAVPVQEHSNAMALTAEQKAERGRLCGGMHPG
jgi:hypothetical protein